MIDIGGGITSSIHVGGVVRDSVIGAIGCGDMRERRRRISAHQ